MSVFFGEVLARSVHILGVQHCGIIAFNTFCAINSTSTSTVQLYTRVLKTLMGATYL